MKARLLCSLGVAAILIVGMLALVSSTQAQTLVLPEPKIEILEESPDSIFVFQVSPTTAQVGQYPIFIMYAWGYMGEPTQALTVTTTFPAGVDPGGCPDGCVQIMHLVRDPYGGPGLSVTLNATATVVGPHIVVAHFQDNMGVSQTLSATLTVEQPPPTAVGLASLSATPTASQNNWMLVALILLAVACGVFFVRRRVHVNNN